MNDRQPDSHVLPLQHRTMSLTQSVWCSIDAIYGSCCKFRGDHFRLLNHQRNTVTIQRWLSKRKFYFVLVDTPYPDDRVPSSSEEPIQCGVKLERVHPISIVLLHLISNHVRHLKHLEQAEALRSYSHSTTLTSLYQQHTHFLAWARFEAPTHRQANVMLWNLKFGKESYCVVHTMKQTM